MRGPHPSALCRQIYAQSMFDTLESWVKSYRLKRAAKASGATKPDVETVAAPAPGSALKPRASMAGG